MPNSLYLAGGRAATNLSAVVLRPDGPGLCQLNDLAHLDALLAEQVPIWLRVNGMGNPHLIREALKRCRIPGCFAPWCWTHLSPPAWIQWAT